MPAIEPVVSPFTVVTDSREQAPYQFQGLHTDARDGRRPLIVPTVTKGLSSGDYSIEGMEGAIAVERKSLSDLYGTLGQGRGRFVRELERLAAMPHAFVVIESEWSGILGSPPERSQLQPKTVLRSVIAWQVRYPTVQWWAVPGRAFAEVLVYRVLERVWKERQKAAETANGKGMPF